LLAACASHPSAPTAPVAVPIAPAPPSATAPSAPGTPLEVDTEKTDSPTFLALVVDGDALSAETATFHGADGSSLPRPGVIAHAVLDGERVVVTVVVYEEGVDEEDRRKPGSPWSAPAPPGQRLGLLTIRPEVDGVDDEVTFLEGYDAHRGLFAITVACEHEGGFWSGSFEGEGTALAGGASHVKRGRFRARERQD
jgi:hypothetical protein